MMNQTPAHEHHNPDLLNLIPKNAKRLIEIGCSSGALAREFKKTTPQCDYLGVEISADYAELAKRYCDEVMTLDIENAPSNFYSANEYRDCWIFGDTLEHLKNPWMVLENIRKVLPENGSVVACIPNVQHWSVQVRLCIGDFRYADSGLFDRTHLRWFTRETITELFNSSGFRVVEGMARIFDEPMRERFLPIIRDMAEASGVDADVAVNDSLPLQYVVRAAPI